MAQPFWKTVWRSLINTYLPHNPAILLLGIYFPKRHKMYVPKVPTKIHPPMFTAALFIIAQPGNTPNLLGNG